jgi:hypothetical protein
MMIRRTTSSNSLRVDSPSETMRRSARIPGRPFATAVALAIAGAEIRRSPIARRTAARRAVSSRTVARSRIVLTEDVTGTPLKLVASSAVRVTDVQAVGSFDHLPQKGTGGVAEHRIRAAGLDGGKQTALHRGVRVPDGKDPAIQPMKATVADPDGDRLVAESAGTQFGARPDTPLSSGELRHPQIRHGGELISLTLSNSPSGSRASHGAERPPTGRTDPVTFGTERARG